MITILECLQNAEINLANVKLLGVNFIPLPQEQLHNAIVLLEKGYPVTHLIDEILNEYDNIESIPDFKP